MRPSRHKYTIDQLKEAVKNSTSIRQSLIYLNLNAVGSAYDGINKRIEENGIDTSHFTGQGWAKDKPQGFKPRVLTTDVLNNLWPMGSYQLKSRLLREGYLEPKCYNCNLTEWNGLPIPNELEHIDGNPKNNSLDNLTILCPNCHAQTSTHAGKNKKAK
jgi:5-methylcytosine-specific restriction endonuclease McrA